MAKKVKAAKPTKPAPSAPPPPATVRVRLDVTAEEQTHLRIMAARAGIRATGDYVRALIRADMAREDRDRSHP